MSHEPDFKTTSDELKVQLVSVYAVHVTLPVIQTWDHIKTIFGGILISCFQAEESCGIGARIQALRTVVQELKTLWPL
jgi:hypothetical protein